MGSGFAQIAVVVEKPYHEKVEGLETEWAVIAEDEKTMTFQYQVKNYYKGDDETIVHSLLGDLPKEIIDGNHFKIDWDKSGY